MNRLPRPPARTVPPCLDSPRRRERPGPRFGRGIAASAILLLAGGLSMTTPAGARASFINTLASVGGGELKAAALTAPSGLNVTDGGCEIANEQNTLVSLNWSSSATLDADGNPLVNRYPISYSTSSAGTYTEAGETLGTTTFTQSDPAGAVTPQLYVANSAAKTVHAVNASSNAGTSITTTGTMGLEPNGMAVTPEGTKVLLAEGASHDVQVLTVATNTVATAVELPKVGTTKSRPDAVAITPSGVAYVVDGANNRVYPFTISSGTLGTGIVVGTQGNPGAIAVSPNGEDVYVANYGSHSVSVISTASNTVIATVAIGAEAGKPIALAVSPSSAHVYVADQGSSQIDDITTSNNAVAHTISVPSMVDSNVAAGGDPNILAVTPAGSKLYVASFTGHGVEDINTSTDALSGTIALAESSTAAPNALALTPNGCQLYVHDHAHNLVDAIKVSSDAVTAHPTVGATGDPTGMSVTPDGTHVYVANAATPSVSVIATSTNAISATLLEATIGKAPNGVLATPSAYYYKLQSGHGGWRSAYTTPLLYPLGFDQGGWQ